MTHAELEKLTKEELILLLECEERLAAQAENTIRILEKAKNG